MARLRHTITLTSVGRGHVERSLDVAHAVLESLRGEGSQLVAPDGRPVVDIALRSGQHLRPGARYGLVDSEGQTVDAELLAWDRGRETGVRIEATEPAHLIPEGGGTASARMVSALWLRGAERPERAEVSLDGALRRPDGRRRRLRWFTLSGVLDLGRWWEAAATGGASPGRPALIVRARHPILRAAVHAGPRPGPDGTWRLDVVVMIRGRGLARPVAAVPLLATRRMQQRALDRALERFAETWRTRVVPELNREPEELHRRLVDHLCTPPGPALPGTER
ncbi:hypothetical protein [Streptomyces johnsoniae]|uniref:Uncharacterized protein n=1 Tax=Streptomyces johnsoniae TaxID=3075532 RepID=A0ABU2S3X1_9ACTN|nr:hypothetical protein [Streptomyces sp. DSM 41886]MDT0443683.1 hypothetical protein [Streptomyces sp. DSM 41886]